MNRLNGLYGYLSGPIDFAENLGADWRNEITPYLESKNVRVDDPLKHSFYAQEEIDSVKRPRMKMLEDEGRFEELRSEMKEVIHWDLRCVDRASFVIVNYDNSVHMCGTYEEIFKANNQCKPVLLKLSCPRNKLSKWMYGRFPPEHMFESWGELQLYVDNIDSNPDYVFTEADKKRWLFDEGDHMRTEKELLSEAGVY